MSNHAVYMLQTREFVNNEKPIYKIGRTQPDFPKRFNQYSNGSKLILHINVKDSLKSEKEILSVFSKKFTCKKELGREYFEGDISKMIKSFFEICCPENDENLTINIDKETRRGQCPRCERMISKKYKKESVLFWYSRVGLPVTRGDSVGLT